MSDLFGARGGGEVPCLVPAGGWPAERAPPPPLRLAVPDRPYLAGRGEDCDLILPTDDVSREHAVIVRRWEGVHIRDLGSKNGVRVAGQPITGEHRLRDGDRVEIGSFELRADDPEDRYLKALEAPGASGRPVAAAGSGRAALGPRRHHRCDRGPPGRRRGDPAHRLDVVRRETPHPGPLPARTRERGSKGRRGRMRTPSRSTLNARTPIRSSSSGPLAPVRRGEG